MGDWIEQPTFGEKGQINATISYNCSFCYVSSIITYLSVPFLLVLMFFLTCLG